jgi:hypothetical protein
VTGPHNLKPEKVVRAILSIPVHKGKAMKQGLLRDQIEKAGLTMEEFLKLYR